MRYVSLVRHGEYTPTPSGGELTARGRRQAAATGKRLAKRGGRADATNATDATALYTLHASTMSRAMESASIIGSHLSVDVGPGHDYLRESIPTGVPGHRVSLEARRKGRERVDTIVAKHLRPTPRPMHDVHDVLVCHGNMIRAVVAVALRARLTTWVDMFIHHGSLTQLVVLDDGRVVLRHYNDIGHFTPRLVTSSFTKSGLSGGSKNKPQDGDKNGIRATSKSRTPNPGRKKGKKDRSKKSRGEA